jgi:RAT1-interacting protein
MKNGLKSDLSCHLQELLAYYLFSTRKLLKFYFQSFLLGVPVRLDVLLKRSLKSQVWQEIIVGFRTPNGQLTTLQSFKTLEMPRMVRGKPNAWDAQICLDWGERFLTWVKKIVTSGTAASESVWRVKFTPRVGVELTLLDDDIARKEVEAGEDRVGFLPTWYWEEIQVASSEHSNTSCLDPKPGPVAAESCSLPTGWQI